MEVNASDDRSPERLRELIYNATQNATLLAHARPNCVILDEIDGIDGSRNALDALTAIVKAPLKSGSAGSSKGGAKSSFALTRPLICICNDQYAPALRDLIKLADVFVFSGMLSFTLIKLELPQVYSLHYFDWQFICAAPQDVRLVQRLRQVCKQEGLNVGNSAFIAELCSATGGDIRASINNLQFAALKSKSLQQKQLQQLQEGHSSSRPSANTGSAWGAAFGRAGSIGSTAKAPGTDDNCAFMPFVIPILLF